MSEDKLRRVTVVIVAFSTADERSIAYKKLDTPSDSELGATINKIIHDGEADFLSIRMIKIDSRWPTWRKAIKK